MADILTRLTTMARAVSDEGEEALLEDAAAEIERLRAALRWYAEEGYNGYNGGPHAARRALEGKDCPQECKTVGNEEAERLRELGYYNVRPEE